MQVEVQELTAAEQRDDGAERQKRAEGNGRLRAAPRARGQDAGEPPGDEADEESRDHGGPEEEPDAQGELKSPMPMPFDAVQPLVAQPAPNSSRGAEPAASHTSAVRDLGRGR